MDQADDNSKQKQKSLTVVERDERRTVEKKLAEDQKIYTNIVRKGKEYTDTL